MIHYYWLRLRMKYHYYITQDMDKWHELWDKANKIKQSS